ncbi:MAG: L-threonylcarbamoyladenylate synthase [Candidatus Aureabacteria bacterium]|nr:L-threonylcarbamoyladenylate synthase [Candidatus Auribacterota bacterium]
MTEVFNLTGGDAECIRKAAEALRGGKLVVFPTETVYGIGCDASNRGAVERIYAVKGRPESKPLALYLSSVAELGRYVESVPEVAEKLISCFWPGPLTLLLSRGGGGERIGFRMPDDENALALIRESGCAIAGTSANRSGAPCPVSGDEAVRAMRGLADIVLRGGRTRYAGESTIIDLGAPGPVIVREGVIGREEIEAAVGIKVMTNDKFHKSRAIRRFGD